MAPIAHTVGPTQLLRIVDAARALYDPAEARARAERAAERREVRIYRDHPVNGVVEVVAGLDYADMEGSPALATIERVREWCTTAGTNVRVTPVVDLNDDLHRDGYQPSSLQREQAALLDRTCVHPFCTRRARACDLDHIEPYLAGGQTASANLAPLCRRHHRLKTFGGWSYERVGRGRYRWTSPGGRRYLRDREGTTEVGPGP